jgi:hypothetical protein
LKDKCVGLIKWQKAGLDDLLGNLASEEELDEDRFGIVRRRAPKLSRPFNFAPTTSQWRVVLNLTITERNK